MRRTGSAQRQGRDGVRQARQTRVWLVSTLAFLCFSTPAAAVQEVLGRVTAPGGAAAAGVLVQLEGAAGAVVSLTVTDRSGRFRFEDRLEGRLIRALPIGRAPVSVTVPAAGSEAALTLSEARLDMAAIRSGASEQCEPFPSATSPTGQLLAEVRKALLAEAWARTGRRFAYDVFQYERLLGLNDRIEEERGRQVEGLDTGPARSRPAAELEAEGFARTTPRGEILFAPDADVLLSDEFMRSRCWRIAAENSGARRVGVAFAPAASDRVDIEGVIWVDPATAELRTVEFSYTNLTEERQRRPTGGLEFQRLADGLWTVSRWWLRSPLPRGSGSGFREEGVETLRVVYPDGMHAPVLARARLLGLVMDSADAPVPGARVRLLGTDYEAFTNSEGRFLIPELPPGHYRMGIMPPSEPDSVMGTQDVRLGANLTTQVEMRMVAQARPTAQADGGLTALDSIRWVLRSVGLRTTARVDSLITEGLTIMEPGRLIGRVFDRGTGRGIHGAEVRLAGTNYAALTASDGRFSMGDIAPGRYVIDARMLGYTSRADTITIPPGLVIDADVSLATQAIELEPITVTVHSRWLESNGFFERRRAGLAGTFLTRADIENLKPSQMTDLLRTMPGVMMSTDEVGRTTVRFRRITTLTGFQAQEEGSRGCTPGVYYDGIPLNAGWDRLHNIPIPFLDGIEVYVGAATPIQYRHPCGVILIWTRRPK